jgi:hypothetical protein
MNKFTAPEGLDMSEEELIKEISEIDVVAEAVAIGDALTGKHGAMQPGKKGIVFAIVAAFLQYREKCGNNKYVSNSYIAKIVNAQDTRWTIEPSKNGHYRLIEAVKANLVKMDYITLGPVNRKQGTLIEWIDSEIPSREDLMGFE